MPPDLRPPDAGTANEWTFAGEGKVYAWNQGLPAVLGRPDRPPFDGVIAIRIPEGIHGWRTLVITPHQARALMEILPAAIAKAEATDD